MSGLNKYIPEIQYSLGYNWNEVSHRTVMTVDNAYGEWYRVDEVDAELARLRAQVDSLTEEVRTLASNKNPAAQPQDELNDFTHMIAKNSGDGNYWVRLRDGALVRPVFNSEEEAFFTTDYKMCWNLDGTSMKRSDYDMMEIVKING